MATSTKSEAVDQGVNPTPRPPASPASSEQVREMLRKLARALTVEGLKGGDVLATRADLRGPLFLFALVQLRQALGHALPAGHSAAAFRASLSAQEEQLGALFPEASRSFRRFWRALEKSLALRRLLEGLVQLNALPNSGDELSWFYQYLKTPLEQSVVASAHRGGPKLAGEALLVSTQFFTEPYMVEFLTRCGLAPLVEQKAPLEQLRVLDPACGGGNFLIAALDFLFRAYQGTYPPQQLVDMLLGRVLVGYDLDPLMAEVAALGIVIHASRLLGALPSSLPLTFGGLPGDERGFLEPSRVPKVESALGHAGHIVILTNPPFLGRRLMSLPLKEYLHEAYPLAKADLCAAFLIRCLGMLRPGDRFGVVHQTNWMFLSSFVGMRKWLLDRSQIEQCADLGANAFSDLSGEKVRVALSVFSHAQPGRKSRFLRLVDADVVGKQAALRADTPDPRLLFEVESKHFLENADCELHYHAVRQKASVRVPTYGDFAVPMQGTSTGDNDRFIKFSWEVPEERNEWRAVSKGGGYCKWLGLNRYVVLWGERGERISQNPGSALRNVDKMESTQLVYSDTGTAGLNVRLLRPGQLFIASGPGIAVREGEPFAHMAYLNSRLASAFMRMLSPKLTIAAGYIRQLPFPETLARDSELVKRVRRCVELKDEGLSRKLGNDEFRFVPPRPVRELDRWLEQAILEDLGGEAERLSLEWECEQAVRRHFPAELVDEERISAEVGRCAAALPGADVEASAELLDESLAGTLDAACRYRPGTRRGIRFGCEGSLEALAQARGIAPAALLDSYQREVTSLRRVKALYFEDLLHRATLHVLGFSGDRRWRSERRRLRDVADELDSLLPVGGDVLRRWTNVAGLEAWLGTRLPALHSEVFWQRPVLRVEHSHLVLSRPSS
jgi:hypothetical protein